MINIETLFQNVFVVHVRVGYADRKKHIDSHLPHHGIADFSYVLDYDIADLTEEHKNKYFYGGVRNNNAAMSCSSKHLEIYRKIIASGLKQALIFEDDAILVSNFKTRLFRSLHALDESRPYIVNFEATNHRVPILFRRLGKRLYRVPQIHLSGGYIINNETARIMLDYATSNRMSEPIDEMMSIISRERGIDMYWVDPPLMKQGSKTGRFHSILTNRKKDFVGRGIRWLLMYWYQRTIVSNFSPKRIKKFRKWMRTPGS